MLSQIPYKDSNGKRLQAGFGGLVHTPACADGELYDSKNLCADNYPLLSTRKKRGLYKTLTKANGLAARDVLMWVDGTSFVYDGSTKGTVADSKKAFVFMGPWVVIWPDKAYYNVLTDEFGMLEETYISGAGQISFSDGTYADVAADANSITTSGVAFYFEVGDAVTITGCTVEANNAVFIIREISTDKKTLRFYENAFSIASGTSYTEAGAITIARKVPDMDFLCQNDNRLWGCKGDEIFASHQGNPKVWMDYDGVDDGSWAVAVGSEGNFVGCTSFLGYPIFFKESGIHKVYGSFPSEFKTMTSARLGVMKGCDKSFAIAEETLFYRSRTGVVRYTGGYPYAIDKTLGNYSPVDAAAGTDMRKYFISGYDANGDGVFLCYDARYKTWMKEDETVAIDFALAETGLYFLSGNEIWKIENDEDCTEENPLLNFAEFGDIYEGSPQKKLLISIQIIADVEENETLEVYLQANGGDWTKIGTLTGSKQMHKLPLKPLRCDYWRLKLSGTGAWTVYSIAREYAQGSDN